MMKDRLAARLRETFLGELGEQLQVMTTDLLALEREPMDAGHMRSLFRCAHTLKGAARAADVPAIETLCHALESTLAAARDNARPLERKELALFFEVVDALGDAADRMGRGESLGGSALERLSAAAAAAAPPASAPRAARAVRVESVPDESRVVAPPSLVPPSLEPSGARPLARELGSGDAPDGGGDSQAAPERTEGQLRIGSDQLDALLASASQLRLASDRAVARSTDIEALREMAARTTAGWRSVLRLLRGGPGERNGSPRLLRALAEADEQGKMLSGEAARLARISAQDGRVLAQHSAEVEKRARRLRMRPFSDACQALPRVVRDVSAASGREVRLEILGGDVEADRAVLDGIREALVHLVRNAIDHGIETPAERMAAGKPPEGHVSVSAALRGDRLTVTVADDGAGLRLGRIRERLAASGRTVPDSDEEVAQALLEGGISTRDEVTTVSGRGVGLDIVHAAVERIGGLVDVRWQHGAGATFVLDLPPTLLTIRALLIAVGPQRFAIPTANVQRMLRVRPEDLRRAGGRDVIVVAADDGGEPPLPIVSLARVLGPPLAERPVDEPTPAVIVTAARRRVAVLVDQLLAEQEITARPVERSAGAVPVIGGAALLGTGEVALVLHPSVLVDMVLDSPGESVVSAARALAAQRHRILVVDDSITTRTLEQSVLEAAGYDVGTAVDGADAWRRLQEQSCDLVVADVEMPRMDGIELCATIRASKRLRNLPVILVTALESPEHRERGLEAGADAYLGKSSFEKEQLLDLVRQLLGSGDA